MEKKVFLICFWILILSGIVFAWISIKREKRLYHDGSLRIYQDQIRDKIKSIAINKSTAHLKLSNGKEYYFSQTTDSYLSDDLAKYASAGDSVFKKESSDTIIIEHNGKLHHCEINRVEND